MVFTMVVQGGWSRRAVLGAAGGLGIAGVLAGCGWLEQRESAPPPPDPLAPLLAATRALIIRYDEALAAHPDLAAQLRPLHEAHLAHEAALLAMIDRPDLASTGEEAAWRAPASGAPGDGDAQAVVAALREAERAGQADAAQACLSAPPERAPLLGSITAARACHVEVLT